MKSTSRRKMGWERKKQITSGHKGFMFQPLWSPDSSKIAWADKDLKFWYVDIKDKKPVEVDQRQIFRDHQLLVVAGQQWLAYDKPGRPDISVVYLYGLADQKDHAGHFGDEQQLMRRCSIPANAICTSFGSRLQRSSGQY